MNNKLIYDSSSNKALILTDDNKKKEVTYYSQLPEYLNLENAKETLEKNIANLNNKGDELAKKLAYFYNCLPNNEIGVFSFIAYFSLFIMIFISFIFIDVNGPLSPTFIFIRNLLLTYGIGYKIILVELQKWLSKNYGCKNIISNLVSKINKSKLENLEKQLSLVKERLEELDYYKEREKVSKQEDSELKKQDQTIIYSNFNEESLKRLEEELEEMRKNNLYDHSRELKLERSLKFPH